MWWTSDQHFGHANIIKYCARPFASAAEMDAHMITCWNAVVQPKDLVVVVGDFSFHHEEETARIVTALHGEKILIRGNHDRRKTNTFWKRVGFREVHAEYRAMITGLETVYVKHEPEPYGGSWRIQFNGHVHERWKTRYYSTTNQLYINVGVDQWAYTPVSTETLRELAHARRKNPQALDNVVPPMLRGVR